MHDIVLSIPLGVFVALIAYRSHYASLFKYRNNHMYLPWSADYRSVNGMVRAPKVSSQYNTPTRNKTAVRWPRAQKSQSEGTGEGSSIGVGLDGAVERRIYGPGILRFGRARQDLFPKEQMAASRERVASEAVLPESNIGSVRCPSMNTTSAVGGSMVTLRRVNTQSGGTMV